jgi:hypothetical protein
LSQSTQTVAARALGAAASVAAVSKAKIAVHRVMSSTPA